LCRAEDVDADPVRGEDRAGEAARRRELFDREDVREHPHPDSPGVGGREQAEQAELGHPGRELGRMDGGVVEDLVMRGHVLLGERAHGVAEHRLVFGHEEIEVGAFHFLIQLFRSSIARRAASATCQMVLSGSPPRKRRPSGTRSLPDGPCTAGVRLPLDQLAKGDGAHGVLRRKTGQNGSSRQTPLPVRANGPPPACGAFF
jgi:hypothetical protein